MASKIPADEERCVSIVYHNRAGSSRCPNRAKPGTDTCGVHTIRTVDRTSREPTTTAEVHTARETRVFVELTWDPEHAPVSAQPYTKQRVAWTKVRMSGLVGAQDPTTWSGRGLVLRSDGSVGAREASESYARLDLLPESVRTQLLELYAREVQR